MSNPRIRETSVKHGLPARFEPPFGPMDSYKTVTQNDRERRDALQAEKRRDVSDETQRGIEAAGSPRPEQTFFDDPATDRLMGVVWALASEVYVLRDRLTVLESALSQSGHIDLAALQTEASPEELQAQAADRDAFVGHLMDNLAGIQMSKGALR